ncbi:MAG: NAD-dependent epimerase/dehydratase family protein, partial [Anaerolineae bacterium]|nr:NAD-dependent epimerase/dehydratase family protein [Phycisphaerae bacterium]
MSQNVRFWKIAFRSASSVSLITLSPVRRPADLFSVLPIGSIAPLIEAGLCQCYRAKQERVVAKGNVVVCGGGGFIGGHFVGDLLKKGFNVRCVDVKPQNEWYQVHGKAENVVADLNLRDKAFEAVKGCDTVYNLACNMGGMGFIEKNKGLCMVSVLINTHLLLAARELGGIKKFFYASSACVYNGDKQTSKSTDVYLREEDAYPAMPEDGYGWEKLFS